MKVNLLTLQHRQKDSLESIRTISYQIILCMFHLQVISVIPKPEVFQRPGPCTTVGLCSDGVYFYWLWCAATLQEKNAKGINVSIETFTIDVSSYLFYQTKMILSFAC